MALDKDLIDKLLGDYQKPEDLIGENGLLKQLTKALVERALNAELTHHLGYEKNDAGGRGSGNSRNGASRKTLTGDFGEVEIEVPRDRVGDFDPKIVGKHQRRFTGFDDKILSMYARGMSTREIQGHLQEIYGAEVSPDIDFRSDGCRHRRAAAMAEPATGADIRHHLSGCVDGEDAA
jgi:putative transposase